MNAAVLDAYLATARPKHRAALRQLHDAVVTAVPDVELVLRRRVPAYRYRQKPLVSIGDAETHVALYVMQGTVLTTHAARLRRFDTSRTVVRFDPSAAIPAATVRALVRARADEIRRSRAARAGRAGRDAAGAPAVNLDADRRCAAVRAHGRR